MVVPEAKISGSTVRVSRAELRQMRMSSKDHLVIVKLNECFATVFDRRG